NGTVATDLVAVTVEGEQPTRVHTGSQVDRNLDRDVAAVLHGVVRRQHNRCRVAWHPGSLRVGETPLRWPLADPVWTDERLRVDGRLVEVRRDLRGIA